MADATARAPRERGTGGNPGPHARGNRDFVALFKGHDFGASGANGWLSHPTDEMIAGIPDLVVAGRR